MIKKEKEKEKERVREEIGGNFDSVPSVPSVIL